MNMGLDKIIEIGSLIGDYNVIFYYIICIQSSHKLNDNGSRFSNQ